MRKYLRRWLGGGINSFLSWILRPTEAGVDVSEMSVMGLSAYWCGVNQIADGLMHMPLTIRRFEEGGERQRGREHSVIAAPRFMRQIRQGMVDVEADDHPINDLFKRGVFSYLDPTDFTRMVVYHLLTHGNSYWHIDGNSRGQVKGLQPLLPDRIEVDVKNGEIIYRLRHTGENGGRKELKAEEVLHVKGLTRDGIHGLSPIGVLREDLGLALAANRYGARFFANDATPTTVLQTESDTLTRDQMDAIMDEWERDQGGENQRSTALLWGGVTAERIGLPPDDSQFLQTRVHSVQDVARILGLPPSKLYDMTRSTFNNVVQENISFGNDTLRPHATRICAAIDSQLLMHDPNYFCAFDASNMQWADQKTRFETYEIGIRSKFYSGIEARRSEGLPDEMPEGEIDDQPDPPMGEADEEMEEEEEERATRVQQRVDSDAFMADLIDSFEDTLNNATTKYGQEIDDFFELMAEEFIKEAGDRPTKWIEIAVDTDDKLDFLIQEIDEVVKAADIAGMQDEQLRALYERLTDEVLESATEAVNNVIGVSIQIPDPVQRQIIADGGMRVGLVDMDQDTKDAVFKMLHDRRAKGDWPLDIAKELKDYIEAGRFVNAGPEYRARLIAREESVHAQRVSSIRLYDEAGWQIKLVDGQMGDASDADCKARNGKIVTIEGAQQEMDNHNITHPNCTLAFMPYFQDGVLEDE